MKKQEEPKEMVTLFMLQVSMMGADATFAVTEFQAFQTERGYKRQGFSAVRYRDIGRMIAYTREGTDYMRKWMLGVENTEAALQQFREDVKQHFAAVVEKQSAQLQSLLEDFSTNKARMAYLKAAI